MILADADAKCVSAFLYARTSSSPYDAIETLLLAGMSGVNVEALFERPSNKSSGPWYLASGLGWRFMDAIHAKNPAANAIADATQE
mmetsp:Transcript_5680/g.9561  ORF Transcript_5680/g.9561 Transcript_5680/m.9561 type:complete len:86 (-) Transcript_5680:140-397(-)